MDQKYDGGGKASFARFEHPGRRTVETVSFESVEKETFSLY